MSRCALSLRERPSTEREEDTMQSYNKPKAKKVGFGSVIAVNS